MVWQYCDRASEIALQIPFGACCRGLRDNVTNGGKDSLQRKKVNPQLLKLQVIRTDSLHQVIYRFFCRFSTSQPGQLSTFVCWETISGLCSSSTLSPHLLSPLCHQNKLVLSQTYVLGALDFKDSVSLGTWLVFLEHSLAIIIFFRPPMLGLVSLYLSVC